MPDLELTGPVEYFTAGRGWEVVGWHLGFGVDFRLQASDYR
jgi:hypothetical protein